MSNIIITVKQYADRCGISPQAAIKRLAKPENYKEIVSFHKINKNFFLITINKRKGYTKNATTLQR